MDICSYICTRTHYIKDNFSISFIYDSKRGIFYVLKGFSSNLWGYLVKYQDFDKVMSYARTNNLENELLALLFELKEKEIINTNRTFERSKYNFLANTISNKSKNIQYFISKYLKFYLSHDLLNTLILELNYKCNLSCKHCYNHKNMNEYYLTFEQAKKAIDQAYDMGISIVRLTGGECTLNKDFLKICEYIKSKHLELYIYTNGQIFNDDENLFKQIINLYPTYIQYSLYSMDPDVHDSITKVKNSWQKTINVIKKSIEAGISVKIATQVLSYNKDSYKEVIKFANSIGAMYNDNCVFTNNPENKNLNSKLSYEEIKQYYINKSNKIHFKPSFIKNDMSICEAGFDRLCITPKFDVIPCVAFDYILGNLNSTTLAEIKKTTLKEFRKIFLRKNLTECFNEEYCGYCFYCPDTSSYDNTFMKKQSIFCENAKAYYEAVKYIQNKDKTSGEFSKI